MRHHMPYFTNGQATYDGECDANSFCNESLDSHNLWDDYTIEITLDLGNSTASSA